MLARLQSVMIIPRLYWFSIRISHIPLYYIFSVRVKEWKIGSSLSEPVRGWRIRQSPWTQPRKNDDDAKVTPTAARLEYNMADQHKWWRSQASLPISVCLIACCPPWHVTSLPLLLALSRPVPTQIPLHTRGVLVEFTLYDWITRTTRIWPWCHGGWLNEPCDANSNASRIHPFYSPHTHTHTHLNCTALLSLLSLCRILITEMAASTFTNIPVRQYDEIISEWMRRVT